MRKLFSFLVVMTLTFSIASADMAFSDMSDQELYVLIYMARNELHRRIDNKEYLVDDSYIRITKSSEAELTEYTSGGLIDKCFDYGIVISNISDMSYEVIIDNIAINGWEADTHKNNSGIIRSGMNKKFFIELMYSDADLDDFRGMKDIAVRFTIKKDKETINSYDVTFEFHGDDWT